MSKGGWIKIHRKILDWCWYYDIKTFKLFMHLLLKANFKKKQWQNETVKIGEFISSYKHLAQDTGLSIHEVKTAITHLEKTGEIAKRSTTKYTVFTVTNYIKYQETRKLSNGTILYDSPLGEDWGLLDEDIGDGFDDWENEIEADESLENIIDSRPRISAKSLFKKTNPSQGSFD